MLFWFVNVRQQLDHSKKYQKTQLATLYIQAEKSLVLVTFTERDNALLTTLLHQHLTMPAHWEGLQETWGEHMSHKRALQDC
jgi:hypothetical protein